MIDMDSGVYERDGYMVIEDVLDLKDLSYYQNELDAILEPSWAVIRVSFEMHC